MSQNNNEEHKNQGSNGQHNGRAKRRFNTLVVDGTRYRTLLTEKYKKRMKYEPGNWGKIQSEFPGTVVSVDVSEGDYVQKGDRLYIYDAMKMKNRAYSPVEGQVKEVRIKENDIIRKGQFLFLID
jgi:biotin carboxyl carrier protein